MKRLLFVLFLIFGLFLGTIGLVAGQSEDCPVGENDSWRGVAVPVLTRYDELIKNLSNELETVAELQELRRQIEEATKPDCVEAYDETMLALNLAGDSIVASLVDNSGLADELLPKSLDAFDRAVSLLVGGLVQPTSTEPIAVITEPVDGSEINSFDVKIRGDYNPNLLGDNHIWIFVAPPGSHLFPQPINGCDPAERDSAVYIEAFGSWEVSATFGTPEAGNGDSFDIYLLIGDEDATNEIYNLFDTWCEAGDFPGISANSVFSMSGFVPVERVTVIRNDD